MRKKVFGKQLKRGRNARQALFRSLIVSLIEYGHITTTKAKAKAVLPDIDGLVNLAKDGSVAAMRRLHAELAANNKAVKRLSTVVAPSLGDRNSGYVRTLRMGARAGDNAEMAKIMWVNEIKEEPTKKSEKKEKKAKKAAPAKTKKSDKKDTKKTAKKEK